MDASTGILILAVLFITSWICWPSDPKRRRMMKSLKRIPGPFALPIIGTLYLGLFTAKEDFFQAVDAITRRYWPIFQFWYGTVPEVNISEAEHVETILRSSVNIKKGFTYDFLHPWLGTGLLTSKGEKWHSRRKMITPSFHFKILESFQDVFTEKCQILVEKLEKEVGNAKGFDVCPYISRCTLDIICETAMGTTVNAQDTDSPYVAAIHEISYLMIGRIFCPLFHPDFVYFLTKEGKKFKECLKILHSFSNMIIQERKENLMRKTELSKHSSSVGERKRMAFLDMLLEASQNGAVLSDEDIREEIDTFMFEGHDTISASLSWTLFLLGNYPDVQERVFQEQSAIFGDSDRLPNVQDLAEMKYLERVIKESLRLYPSVPVIMRSLIEDIEFDDYFLTEGCQVTVHIYHVHRNPKYFPDPETFNPDNFLPEKVQARHPFAYIPFSAGSRNCIGQKFALQEEKSVISAILRHFRVTALHKPSEVKLTGELILRSASGIHLTLERRRSDSDITARPPEEHGLTEARLH